MIESDNIVKAVKWLGKFRKKLAILLIFPLVVSLIVYFFSDFLITILTRPLGEQKLYFMTPAEGFTARMKVSFFGGLFLSFPVIIYMLASIFTDIIPKSIKKTLHFILIPFSVISMYGGTTFAYIFIFPTTIKFLLSCGIGIMDPMISGSDYISFAAFFLLTVGLVFELPLVLVGLSKIGIITSKKLKAKRKFAILIIFASLAVLTPTPDAFTLIAISLPVILLYEISIWWIFFMEKTSKSKNELIGENNDEETTP